MCGQVGFLCHILNINEDSLGDFDMNHFHCERMEVVDVVDYFFYVYGRPKLLIDLSFCRSDL